MSYNSSASPAVDILANPSQEQEDICKACGIPHCGPEPFFKQSGWNVHSKVRKFGSESAPPRHSFLQAVTTAQVPASNSTPLPSPSEPMSAVKLSSALVHNKQFVGFGCTCGTFYSSSKDEVGPAIATNPKKRALTSIQNKHFDISANNKENHSIPSQDSNIAELSKPALARPWMSCADSSSLVASTETASTPSTHRKRTSPFQEEATSSPNRKQLGSSDSILEGNARKQMKVRNL